MPRMTVMNRVGARLIPFLGLCFFLASLDRMNISVAALTMNGALGLSAENFGVGVGAFYVTYVLFAVPSNIALSRLGARRWLAALLVFWGLISMTMAEVKGVTGFVAVRLALGAAEAGLFPGVVFFALRWFPSAYRARFMALFIACGVAAAAIGPAISVQLLRLDGVLGLEGWQWLFLLEGLPAIALGLFCLKFIADTPSDARWLSADDRSRLAEIMDAERPAPAARQDAPVSANLLTLPIVSLLILSAGIEVGTSALGYWLPTVLKSMDISDLDIGSLISGFGLCGLIAMYLWSRQSDRLHERRWHLAVPMLLCGAGLALSGLFLAHTALALTALCLAVIGVTSAAPILWSMPERYLPPRIAAAGIALINSVGNVAGVVSPIAVGGLRDATGDFRIALIASGAPMILAAACIPLLKGRKAPL